MKSEVELNKELDELNNNNNNNNLLHALAKSLKIRCRQGHRMTHQMTHEESMSEEDKQRNEESFLLAIS